MPEAWIRLEPLLARLGGPAPPPVVSIIGPGGSGLDEASETLTVELHAAGRPVTRWRGRRLERDDEWGAVADLLGRMPADLDLPGARRALEERVGAGGVLLVEDAQWLDAASAAVLVGLADRVGDHDPGGAAAGGPLVVVLRRPWPERPELHALDQVAQQVGEVIGWGPLDVVELAERARRRDGVPLAPSEVAELHAATGGVAWLADAAIRGEPGASGASGTLGGAGAGLPGTDTGSPGAPTTPLPAGVATVVRARLGTLDPVARRLLLLRAHAGPHPPAIEAAVAASDLAGLSEASAVLGAEGLVDPASSPAAPPPLLSRALAAVVDAAELAQVAVALDEARRAQGMLGLVVDRAGAALRRGDDAEALAGAESVLSGERSGAPDREAAVAVAVAVLAARQLHERAADLADRVAGQVGSAGGSGRLASLATLERLLAGDLDGAVTASGPDSAADGGAAPGSSAPGGVLTDPWPDAVTGLRLLTAGSADAGLRLLGEVVDLGELRPDPLSWPEDPHALAALAALAAVDLPRAARFVQRGIESGAGGVAGRRRLVLLGGWIDVRAGRLSRALEAVAAVLPRPARQAGSRTGDQPAGETAGGAPRSVGDEGPVDGVRPAEGLAPRDLLLVAAIEVAVARRSGDVAQLTEAWGRAKPVLLGARPDLLSLPAIGELAAAAIRMGAPEAARPVVAAAEELLVRAGQPVVWSTLLRWDELLASSAAGDTARARELAEALAGSDSPLPAHQVLRAAAGIWTALLDGAVDPEQVTEAADALGAIGLAWEATFLVGQAAIRSTDSRVTRALLGRARDMKGTVGAEPERLASDTSLSDREVEIALLVRDGLTHREIGERLFISPKTVEHHVARIRQKLGASTRAEMLAAIGQLVER